LSLSVPWSKWPPFAPASAAPIPIRIPPWGTRDAVHLRRRASPLRAHAYAPAPPVKRLVRLLGPLSSRFLHRGYRLPWRVCERRVLEVKSELCEICRESRRRAVQGGIARVRDTPLRGETRSRPSEVQRRSLRPQHPPERVRSTDRDREGCRCISPRTPAPNHPHN
jgi:hypothetical protein